MFEAFVSETAKDFRQRYQNTYGFFTTKETNKRILVVISNVEENKVDFYDVDRNQYSAQVNMGVQFEFVAPVKRLFTDGKIIMLIQRKPARQWQRGLSSSNTSITNIDTGANITLNFSRVQEAYGKSHVFNPKDHAKYLSENSSICLLSDMFAFVGDTLYLYNVAVGKVNKETKVITMDQKVFHQEVCDLLRNINLPYSVEISNE